jgi:hypothetical protein
MERRRLIMSRPKYRLVLCVGDMKTTRKMKSVLGDIEELQREMESLDIAKLAETLEEVNGGRAKMERRWNKAYSKFVGHDHHSVSPDVEEEYWDIVKEEGDQAFLQFAKSCKWLKISGCGCPERKSTVCFFGKEVDCGSLARCDRDGCPIFEGEYNSKNNGGLDEG